MNNFQPIVPFFEGGVFAPSKCSSFEYIHIWENMPGLLNIRRRRRVAEKREWSFLQIWFIMSPLTPHKCKSGEEMQIYLKRSALYWLWVIWILIWWKGWKSSTANSNIVITEPADLGFKQKIPRGFRRVEVSPAHPSVVRTDCSFLMACTCDASGLSVFVGISRSEMGHCKMFTLPHPLLKRRTFCDRQEGC